MELQQSKKYFFLIIYFFIIEVFFYVSVIPDKTSRQILLEHKELLEYSCCLPQYTDKVVSDIIFLKTNQPGSSIIFKILCKFGINFGLSFMLPENPSDTSIYPASGTQTSDNRYNIITHYSTFTSELINFANTGALKITVLQDPITLFEAFYNEYKLTNPKSQFSDFLTFCTSNHSVLNPMSSQLGLTDANTKNDTVISEFITKIERQFDLVLIYEHLDASLVLMANLMGWPLQSMAYIVYPSVMNYRLNEIQRIKISELNYADSILYDYFLTKMENCVIQYGVSQLLQEMKALADINLRMGEYCSKEISENTDLQENYSWECTMLFMAEDDFVETIKKQQIRTLQREREMESTILTERFKLPRTFI